MGCNCKRKADAIADAAGGYQENEEHGWLWKIGMIPVQLVFGIICFALIIVMVVPFLLYLLFCLVTGSEANVRFTKKGIKLGKNKKKWETAVEATE